MLCDRVWRRSCVGCRHVTSQQRPRSCRCPQSVSAWRTQGQQTTVLCLCVCVLRSVPAGRDQPAKPVLHATAVSAAATTHCCCRCSGSLVNGTRRSRPTTRQQRSRLQRGRATASWWAPSTSAGRCLPWAASASRALAQNGCSFSWRGAGRQPGHRPQQEGRQPGRATTQQPPGGLRKQLQQDGTA